MNQTRKTFIASALAALLAPAVPATDKKEVRFHFVHPDCPMFGQLSVAFPGLDKRVRKEIDAFMEKINFNIKTYPHLIRSCEDQERLLSHINEGWHEYWHYIVYTPFTLRVKTFESCVRKHAPELFKEAK